MSSSHTAISLDPEQQQMLSAIVSIWNKNPRARCNYPMIADEMVLQNGGKTPCLDALRKNKIPLIQAGLIRDEGVGFVPTQDGVNAYHSKQIYKK